MIYSIYGQPGSGKTTLSRYIADCIRFNPTGHDPYIIDGDEFRKIFNNKNYSKKGRQENIRKVNTIATYLKKTDIGIHVILALVNPYKHLRDELKKELSKSKK